MEEAYKISTEGHIQINKEKEQCWGEETQQWGRAKRLQLQNKGEEDTLELEIVLKLNECLSEGHSVSSLVIYPGKNAEHPEIAKRKW